jgi:hypothetical protein
VIVETAFGPDLRLWNQDVDDCVGLTFDEARHLIVTSFELSAQDWRNYTEEEFLEREQ